MKFLKSLVLGLTVAGSNAFATSTYNLRFMAKNAETEDLAKEVKLGSFSFSTPSQLIDIIETEGFLLSVDGQERKPATPVMKLILPKEASEEVFGQDGVKTGVVLSKDLTRAQANQIVCVKQNGKKCVLADLKEQSIANKLVNKVLRNKVTSAILAGFAGVTLALTSAASAIAIHGALQKPIAFKQAKDAYNKALAQDHGKPYAVARGVVAQIPALGKDMASGAKKAAKVAWAKRPWNPKSVVKAPKGTTSGLTFEDARNGVFRRVATVDKGGKVTETKPGQLFRLQSRWYDLGAHSPVPVEMERR